jgi:two-component system, chemotaxis family, sensor kinase CheA
MADLLEKLWPAFVSEVTEQLDSVELLLAKSGSAKSVDVNHLFRNFHTIKGNCSMIGFTSMEVVAHRSEDILAAVRNHEISMNEAVIDILLESISCLKKQFLSANTSRQNPLQDDSLVEKLVKFIATQLTTSAEAVVTQETEEERKAKLATLSKSAMVAVPVLVLGLDPAAKVEQVEAAVGSMAEKARQVGFKALAGSMLHFISTLKSDIPDKRNQLLVQVAEIFDDIRFICAEHNLELGLGMGSKLCRSKLTPHYNEELDILTELLNQLKSSDPKKWEVKHFLNLVEHAGKLSCYSSLFHLDELNVSWRYIKQLVIEVSRGYIVFNKAIIEKLLEIVAIAKSKEALAGGSPEFEKACKSCREELQIITAKHNNERDEIVDLKNEITSKTTLCFDSLVDLKIDVLNKINDAINAGLLAVEIDIDFADEITSEKVLKAVQTLGELAHSRTMFHDIVNGVAQKTSFSFLILSKKTVQDINTILSIIDKGKKTYTILGFEHLFGGVKTEPSPKEVKPRAETHPAVAKEVHEEAAIETDEMAETESLVSETASSLGSLKVDGAAIDGVISDVGELITHHNRMVHLVTQDEFLVHLAQLKILAMGRNDATQRALVFFEQLHAQLNTTNENMQTCLNQIQSNVLDLRVVPISYAFNRFHKFVRTIAKKLDKKVILDVVGEQVKVDKGMIDVLSEPLAHMIRNSIDHGIESPKARKESGKEEFGLIKLKAEQHSGMVVITVEDDGAGLNRSAILEKCISLGMLKAGENYSDDEIFQHVFAPGFSTSKVLTETSGRGVGMDVVKSKIVEVGGTVSIRSKKGKGTVIELKLPISAAIQSVILIDNHGQTLAFPERHIVEVISVRPDDIQVVHGQSALMLRNNIVPLYRLDELVNSQTSLLTHSQVTSYEVVVVANDQHVMGLVVDEALGRAEVLVRDVHEAIRHMAGVSGAAILGDGKVVIILDCVGLFELALNNAQNIIGISAVNAY